MCMGQANNQLIKNRYRRERNGCNTMTIGGRRAQPRLLMTIQIIANHWYLAVKVGVAVKTKQKVIVSVHKR